MDGPFIGGDVDDDEVVVDVLYAIAGLPIIALLPLTAALVESIVDAGV